MTIKRYAGDKLVGVSSDTKPTNIPDGATFYETNTLSQYILTGGAWSALGGGGGGGANLTLSSNGSTVSVNSDSGTDVVILAANSTTAGVLTAEAQTIAGVKTFSNTIIGTANNALYLDGTIASGYQTTAGLSANVATLTSNNSTYFGGYTWAAPSVVGGTTANGASFTYANVSGQVNTATLYATTSANVASVIQANSTGMYISAGSNAISLSNGSSNWIYWADAGATAPTFTTRSAGTKLVLYPALTESQVDYAVGIEPATLWSSVPVSSDSFGFKWYGGTTQAASLTGAGNLTLAGTANATAYYSGTLFVANNTVVYATHLGNTAASSYQTTAGLSANVATLTSNNASYFNGQAAAYYANASNIGSGTLSPSYGGTGVNNGAKTITIGGDISTANSVTTSGNFALTLTQTAATNVTLPTTGTLATLGGSETLTSKTLSSATLSGTLTANGSVGTAGQVLTSNATGVYWSTVSGGGGGGSAVSVSDTAPASPASGDLWFDSTDGTLNLYYNDGTSSQWVSAINNQAYSAYVTKTVNYTAINRDNILADTTAGSFTITLPASPAIGHSVVIYDNGSWGTNNLTIGRNLNTIEGIADDFTLDISSIKVEFIYNGSTWQIYSSLGQSAQAASGVSAGTAAALAIALG